VIARSRFGRSLAVVLSLSASHALAPLAQASPAAAPAHLVTAPEIAGRLGRQAEQRDAQVRQVQQALDLPAAQEAVRARGLDPARVRAAVPHLDDAELQDLSRRAARVSDVAAGHGGDEGLVILAVVLLVAGLVVLVAAEGDGWGWDDCDCW